MDKDELVSLLKDAHTMLKLVFEKYGHEIYDEHGLLFDEYDLVDLESYIESIEGINKEENNESICVLPQSRLRWTIFSSSL